MKDGLLSFPKFLTDLFLIHTFPMWQCLLTHLLAVSGMFFSVRWDVVLRACAKLDAKTKLGKIFYMVCNANSAKED